MDKKMKADEKRARRKEPKPDGADSASTDPRLIDPRFIEPPGVEYPDMQLPPRAPGT